MSVIFQGMRRRLPVDAWRLDLPDLRRQIKGDIGNATASERTLQSVLCDVLRTPTPQLSVSS